MVTLSSSRSITYAYSADGVKRSVVYKEGTVSKTNDYCGSVIYEGGDLSKILTTEGYITLSGTTPTYHYYLKDHLGNNRVVLKQDGATVEQVTHYYPFGGFFEQTAEGLQKYKYNGKELDRTYGLDLYDYGARHYEPALGRFTTMDPLAEKFYSVSPYAYCANNPVRFIDPTGMEFTETAWEQVKRLIKDIDRREAKNSQAIAEKQAKLDVGGLSEKQATKLQKQIGKLSSNSSELGKVKGEIATLAASDQMYDIKMNNSMNVSGAIPGTGEERAGAAFNFINGNFEITLGSNNLGLLAHELKHAYQFETGAYSSGFMRNGAPFYDQADEWEAYSRGALFGGDRISSLPSIYNNLQKGPMDATKLAPIILSMPSELQKLADKTRSAFRVNGVTYKM